MAAFKKHGCRLRVALRPSLANCRRWSRSSSRSYTTVGTVAAQAITATCESINYRGQTNSAGKIHALQKGKRPCGIWLRHPGNDSHLLPAPGPETPGSSLKPRYPVKAAFLADLQATRSGYAVELDGQGVWSGFGPPLRYRTNEDGSISR